MRNHLVDAQSFILMNARVVAGSALLFASLLIGPRLLAQAPTSQSPTEQASSGRIPSSPSAAPAADADVALPTFDAVSVKPSTCPRQRVQFLPGGRIVAPSVPAKILIGIAYGLPFSAFNGGMIGAPGWVDSQCFSIEAHAEGNPPQDQTALMIQSLLADRFKLAVHWESRQLPVYALVLAKPGKTGPQLVPHAADNSTCRDRKTQPEPQPGIAQRVLVPCGGYLISPGHIVVESTLADLAKGISWYQQIDRAVVDRTGLHGIFEITIDYAPSLPSAELGADTNADSSLPSSIFVAVQEQLGLKLESETGPVNVLVIDHIEEPSAN
jgi:uncharacterized protein (TIGR03435 family)